MIQLNLLPDVKTKYISTERTKRLTIMSALAVCGGVIIIVLILVGVTYGSQKSKLSLFESQINISSTQLQSVDGLNKILTIQNQLNSLTALHNQKPVTSRLFTFLPQITPINVYVSDITIKFEDNSLVINGTADTLELVNKFVDTLKFTQYSSDQSEDKLSAFSSVVLASFSKAEKGFNYSATMFFDPAIFSGDYSSISLEVPNITSTRSQTEQPDLIFQEQPVDSTEEADTTGSSN
jgi:Tfp pilus assembly protein PilN